MAVMYVEIIFANEWYLIAVMITDPVYGTSPKLIRWSDEQ